MNAHVQRRRRKRRRTRARARTRKGAHQASSIVCATLVTSETRRTAPTTAYAPQRARPAHTAFRCEATHVRGTYGGATRAPAGAPQRRMCPRGHRPHRSGRRAASALCGGGASGRVHPCAEPHAKGARAAPPPRESIPTQGIQVLVAAVARLETIFCYEHLAAEACLLAVSKAVQPKLRGTAGRRILTTPGAQVT